MIDNIFKVIELDDCSFSKKNGKYSGNAGAKEGIILNNKNWLIKYPKSSRSLKDVLFSYNSTPLSEYIGSHIYQILGYETHNTFLGLKNSKIVVACEDFEVDGWELIEYNSLKNLYDDKISLKLESLAPSDQKGFLDINEIEIQVEENKFLKQIPNSKERFWDCVVIDGVINNNDRNNSNWGILQRDNEFKLAPIYDNGSCFYHNADEDKIKKIIDDYDEFIASANNSRTLFSFNNKINTYNSFINSNNTNLIDAILRVVPILKEKEQEIYDFLDNIPKKYKDYLILTDSRKTYYKMFINNKINDVLVPLYKQYVKDLYIDEEGAKESIKPKTR